jgi:hypothetical protein
MATSSYPAAANRGPTKLKEAALSRRPCIASILCLAAGEPQRSAATPPTLALPQLCVVVLLTGVGSQISSAAMRADRPAPQSDAPREFLGNGPGLRLDTSQWRWRRRALSVHGRSSAWAYRSASASGGQVHPASARFKIKATVQTVPRMTPWKKNRAMNRAKLVHHLNPTVSPRARAPSHARPPEMPPLGHPWRPPSPTRAETEGDHLEILKQLFCIETTQSGTLRRRPRHT